MNCTIKLASEYAAKAKNAKKSKKEFSLSFAAFVNIHAQTHCAYTGVEFQPTGDNKFSYERIDCSLGYIDGNVVPVARWVNTVRGSLEDCNAVDKELGEIAQKISNRVIAINNTKVLIDKAEKELSANLALTLDKSDDGEIVKKFVIRDDGKTFKKLVNQISSFNTWTAAIEEAESAIRTSNDKIIEIKSSNVSKAKKENQIRHHQELIFGKTRTVKKYKNLIAGLKRSEFIRSLETRNYFKSPENAAILIERKRLRGVLKIHQDTFDNGIARLEHFEKIERTLKDVKKGLKKFENLSKMDKQCLKLGFPLGTSSVKILKHLAAIKLTN